MLFATPGRDWAKLASAVGTKNEKQIKNFYYDWKKGKSRPPSEKKVTKKERAAKAQEELRDEGIIELQEDVVDDRSEEGIELHKKVENPSSQEDFVHQAAALADLRAQAEALAKVQDARQRHGIVELADVSDYPGANHDLIQQFLNQQYQQQGQQQPQSALQQLLGQQQLHREQQHRNQLSLEDARRLLEHHQAQRGPLLSNLLSSQWLGAPQMLPGQPGLSSHSITSALRADGSAIGSGISEMGGEFQRLLHLHRASQGIGMQNRSSNLASLLLGAGGGELSGSNSNNLSANILHQLASVGTGSDASDHLSSLVNAQSLLGFGGGANVGASSIASSLYRQTGTGGMDSAGVSDALSLLARSMQRSEGNSHGLGRMHDSSDGSTRYN